MVEEEEGEDGDEEVEEDGDKEEAGSSREVVPTIP